MTSATIHRETLNDEQRGAQTAKLFGIRFPLLLESFVFDTAGSLSTDYTGGYWHFYTLSNGAFYMAPDSQTPFHVICDNGYEGDMSADAFGITACLYAYSLLSFSADAEFAETCAQHFHWLRDYMLEQAEVAAILRAID